MSPNEQKITPGCAAIASALSISSSGVTHTGHPGPCTISIPAGSIWSIPFLMIEWVCPPQTSMIFHGRVVTWWISRAMRCAISPLRNSVRYFISHYDPSRIASIWKSVFAVNAARMNLPERRPLAHRFFLFLRWTTASIRAGRLRRHRRPRKHHFFSGQFLFQHPHGAEGLERLLGGLLVDDRDGKPNVHNRIVADSDLGNVIQTNPFDHSPEVHPPDFDHPVAGDLFHSTWNCKAHRRPLYSSFTNSVQRGE